MLTIDLLNRITDVANERIWQMFQDAGFSSLTPPTVTPGVVRVVLEVAAEMGVQQPATAQESSEVERE